MATTAVTSGRAASQDADIYYERRGDGPALLLITGGGGDAGYYSALADLMASQYTVLCYDRRGNSRSRLLRGPAPLTMASQSADAVAVLAANGFTRGHIFGNSGGGTVALDLAARHPGACVSVIAHEPPVPLILPDPSEVMAAFDEFSQVLAEEGWQPAFRFVQTRIGRVPPGRTDIWDLLLRPARVLPPGPHLDLMMRVSGNWEYMTRYEVRPFIDYVPDLDLIAANQVTVAAAHGAQTLDVTELQMGAVVAERLGAPCAEFPGGHTAPLEVPVPFSVRLRGLLEELSN
jgi:pimeloyl-ACP methyl ester carboxylesterase